MRRRLGRLAVVFSLFVPVAGVLAYVAGCVAGAPSAADQANVAAYTLQRQACIDGAEAADTGMAGYRACAARVDHGYGFGDAGGAR